MTHTQTFFPESLILDVVGRSPGLRLVVYLPIRQSEQWFVDNNKLDSLQLRVQLRIFDLRLDSCFRKLSLKSESET
jgi:hypothetical protein